MSTASFVPEIWSAEILTNLNTALVYGSDVVTNRDYDGNPTRGGSVKINSFSDPSVVDYDGTTPLTYSSLSASGQDLLINQAKAFGFGVDDVDKAQMVDAGSAVSNGMKQGAYVLRKSADTYVAGLLKAGVYAGNKLTAIDGFDSVEGAYDTLVDLSVVLDENDVPEEGRYVVVPSSFAALISKDLRFISGSETGAAAMRTGQVGQASGLTVFKSNQVPAGTAGGSKCIIAGHGIATTFASSLNEVEALRDTALIRDIVRGLYVFGAKVTRPKALASVEVVPVVDDES